MQLKTTEAFALLSLAAVQGAASWRIDYLYDEEGALYGGVYRSPAASASPTYFTAVTDAHGDVLELCDADGNAFAAYRYDAWGLPQGEGNYGTGIWTQATTLVNQALAGQIAARQVLRYASYAYDAESGLYYCSAKYYDPATRQWTSGDPAKADGEESAYQYCGGEPVGFVDATGFHCRRVRNETKEDANNRVRLRLVMEWNETRVSRGLYGLQLTLLKTGATVLRKSKFKLSRIALRFSWTPTGHCNHDGKDHRHYPHQHGQKWKVPQPVSGKTYKRWPNCSDHYNVIDAIRNNYSELQVRSRVTYFNRKTGVNDHVTLTFTWTAPD